MDTETGASPSILAYARPAAAPPGALPGALPTTYYPGPPLPPARRGGAALALAAVVLLIIVLACLCRRGGCLKCLFAPRSCASSALKGPARRLAARGWTVYYLQGCGYCARQKALLGGFDRYVEYGPGGVLLGGYTKAPPLAYGAVHGFPHWHNTRTGESRAGFQDAAALAEMAA